MAEALEETIPCEHCNTNIGVNDWRQHARQCIYNEKSQNGNQKRNTMNEPITDGIPCEYCEEQISLNDWDTHSRQCDNTHKRRVEQLKNGIVDESITDTIPCEYCDAQISMHDLEWHSRQCAKTNKHGATNSTNNSGEWTGNEVIPCEYCAAPISIHEWTQHTNQCAAAEKKRIGDIATRISNEPNHDLIPCEYCDESFTMQLIEAHETKCRRKQASSTFQPNAPHTQVAGTIFPFPQHWDLTSPHNLSRHILDPDSTEYVFAAETFHKTLPANQIVQIERIQNRRWYRQYDAHRDDFIERYGDSTERWLFHGCKAQGAEGLIKDCFNRSHAVRCAVGQGIYFATQASTSLSYTQPDAKNVRHMFLARVLVGKTTAGSAATRVCPPGFDTTGGGTVFVTYHDAQAYGEYLILFR